MADNKMNFLSALTSRKNKNSNSAQSSSSTTPQMNLQGSTLGTQLSPNVTSPEVVLDLSDNEMPPPPPLSGSKRQPELKLIPNPRKKPTLSRGDKGKHLLSHLENSDGCAVWSHNNPLSESDRHSFVPSRDQHYLNNLSPSAYQESGLELLKSTQRIYSFLSHSLDKVGSLELEMSKLRLNDAAVQKRSEEVAQKEARFVELENTLSDVQDKFKNASNQLLEVKGEKDKLLEDNNTLTKKVSDLEEEKKTSDKKISDLLAELKQCKLDLKSAEEKRKHAEQVAESVADNQFENALDQVELLNPTLIVDRSLYFSNGVVDGNRIIDPISDTVFFQAPQEINPQGGIENVDPNSDSRVVVDATHVGPDQDGTTQPISTEAIPEATTNFP